MISLIARLALPAALSAALLLAATGCGQQAGTAPQSLPEPSPTATQPTTSPSPSPSPPSPTPPSPTPPSPSASPSTEPPHSSPSPASSGLLRRGSHGPEVLELQQQLVSLGYWLGTADGTFGDATEQAVFAVQKAAGISADGVVGPQTQAALDRHVAPAPRSSRGHVIEVDLARNLLLVVTNGHLDAALNTSTGGGFTYWSHGVIEVARTPVGLFHVYTEVDGLRISPLGELWRPKFFDDGYAIHGDSYVPAAPVSHGCVRISNRAIDWIWQTDQMPIGTTVWVY